MGQMAGKKVVISALVLYLAIILNIAALAAQEPSFRIDMDNLNIQKGVSSSLVVSMTNAQGAKLSSIDGFENFEIISQNSSTSISIVGNDSSYKEDIRYTIMPKTTGQFTLKATVQYKGKTYETNELQVTVSEGSSGEGEAESDLFVKTNISRTDAYLGEKLIVTYELYSRYNIENLGFTDYTAIDGVIAKDTPTDQLKAEYVYLGGVGYAKYIAKQLILDPIKAGTHTIPSFNMQVNVIVDNWGGGFSSFFNQTQAMYLQTEEKELTVKQLPTTGRPKDFSGIVGELKLEGHYSREEVDYGDSLSLQVIASGNCNLDSLKKVFSGEIPGFTVYETQKNTAESVVNDQYHVQKEYEAILVPERNGAIDIKPFSISYFNSVTEKYERAEIPGTTIEVLGDMPQVISSEGGQMPAFETVSINSVNYADARYGYLTIQLNKQSLYGVLIGFSVFIVLALILIWLLVNRRKQDQTLKSLYRQLIAATDINEVYSLFNSMIKHCYKISLKACSQSEIQSNLPETGIAARVADIMYFMESNDGKGCSSLKEKIKDAYKLLHI